ncbi:MAG TPA: long-chain fatty acid--CoA ligase [Kofleriaceae bacterium]|nr:long-chain fatty acid--CoA ligase [Kofleriaceae bacterium]
MNRDLIPHRLLRNAAERPSTIAYQAKVGERWQATTWKTYVEQIRTASRAMMALGLPRGGKVAILGFNRPEWVIFDHAAMLAGGCPAGIYTTCSADEVQYIVHHSEARLVLVENADQLAKVKAKRAELPLLQWIVMMRGVTATGGDVLTWEDFLAKADAVAEAELDKRVDAIEQADLATLIYTSGTTGPPKGVMLSHHNLAWTSQMLVDVGGRRSDDVLLSYLPLSHIAEQMCSVLHPATAGWTVFFAESIEKVPENIKEARPTVFFGVPRIWEKFHAAMSAKLAETTGAKKRLVEWARGVCSKVNAHRDRGESIPRVLELQYRLANRLVISKVKQAIGFDRVRELFSGAAPIAPDVLAFFSSIDLPIKEIYGQSEDSGPTSCNLHGRTKLGSVGSPLPGLEVKLAEDGEILVRGPNVFVGYYKEPEATAETLRDGWLCSGDLGAFDQDGYLTITGRKKEIIITAGGKNIAPKNIEAMLKESPLVGEAVVIGDRRKYLTALVTLEPTAAKDAPADQVRSTIQAKIDQVNQSLARVEQIKKFTVLPRPFGIDTGELTPTMKIKRKVVAQKYAREIEAMYAAEEPT